MPFNNSLVFLFDFLNFECAHKHGGVFPVKSAPKCTKNKLFRKNALTEAWCGSLRVALLANEIRYASISDLDFQISDLTYLVTEDQNLVNDSSRFSMYKEDGNSRIIS